MINIYRYHTTQSDGWRYNYSTNPLLSDGWIYDGLVFRVPHQELDGVVPVFQFHCDQSKTYGGWRYLYSTSEAHKTQGWTCDGIAFYAFATEHDGTVPIYQYHCSQSDGRRYHLSQS
jgi:hypothetical protein